MFLFLLNYEELLINFVKNLKPPIRKLCIEMDIQCLSSNPLTFCILSERRNFITLEYYEPNTENFSCEPW